MVDRCKDTTLKRYAKLAEDLGYEAAANELGLKKSSLRRILREYKKRKGESEPEIKTKILRQLSQKFSEKELRNILNSSTSDHTHSKIIHDFSGSEITFGVITDTHIGSIFTNPKLIYDAFDVFAKEGVDFIAHTGDVFEGLSHRAGHMYECSHLGYSEQLEHGVEVFSQTNHPIYMIDGNHDRWYIKSNGAKIVEALSKALDNVFFLGHDEGDIHLNKNGDVSEDGGIVIKLWHGEDGSSYAFSYRIQKIIESFTGGEKPNVLLCGHTHKALYVYDRHVHCLSGGAIQRQSRWMRSKRQASHTGFWVVKMAVGESGVSWFEPRFYPFYQ